MAPLATRNIVMRPAKGSATVFHTRAAAASAASAAAGSPSASTADNVRCAGDGRYARMASSRGCTPMFAAADVHTSGKTCRPAVAVFSPASNCSWVSVPDSKNCSMRASSASATSSMRVSRAAWASSARSAGTSPVDTVRPSSPKVNARMETRSTTPRNCFSSPIGRWIGATVRPRASCSDSSERDRLARSRSRRLSTTTQGRPSSSATAHTFSVSTSEPATASTTTRAASATRSAQAASLKKLAMPGVSMRLTFVFFHSVNAVLADSVCLRAISSSS